MGRILGAVAAAMLMQGVSRHPRAWKIFPIGEFGLHNSTVECAE